MADPVVRCPACGTAAPVAGGGAARCSRCGLLVSAAAPRPPDPPPPARGRGVGGVVAVLAGGGLIGSGVVVAGLLYVRQGEAERAERSARAERLFADDRAAADADAAWRAGLAALPARLLGVVPPDEEEPRADDLREKLLGVWRDSGAAGGARTVEYRADGTYRDVVEGGPAPRAWLGDWAAAGATGDLRARALVGNPAHGGEHMCELF